MDNIKDISASPDDETRSATQNIENNTALPKTIGSRGYCVKDRPAGQKPSDDEKLEEEQCRISEVTFNGYGDDGKARSNVNS